MPRKPKRHPETPETTLYAPVKRYLEALGFTVKGEVCGCDLVALRGDEPTIVVVGELKLAFSLELVLQGVNRTAACLPRCSCGYRSRNEVVPGHEAATRLERTAATSRVCINSLTVGARESRLFFDRLSLCVSLSRRESGC